MTRNKMGQIFTFGMAMALAAGSLVGCSDDEETPADAGVTADSGVRPDAGNTTPDAGNTTPDSGTTGFVQPEGTVPVNFIIDDSANKLYDEAAGLAWKGSFSYDYDTRVMTLNAGWSGPFALVYDDGPWNEGGHEPAGATAGDSIWGITTFVETGAEAINFEFGAIDGSDNTGRDGNWIWIGPNGTFSVPANASAAIDAGRLTIPAFGTTDLRLVLDADGLAEEFGEFDPANGVRVKGSAWGWSNEVALVDNGMDGDETANDGNWTFVMSENVGRGTNAPYRGLLKTGDEPEFVFVLGGIEYKVGGEASPTGITASVRPEGGNWTAIEIQKRPSGGLGGGNTYVAVP